MSKSLLILGAGSFSTEVAEMAHILGYCDVLFLDDHPDKACSKPIIGSMSDIKTLRLKFDTAIVAMGDNKTRIAYHQILKDCDYHIPVLVHPTAYVSPDAIISSGSIIRANAVISRYVKIGEACIINVGALIDHHVVIGDGSHILMGAIVRNMVKLNPLTRVNSNEVVE